MARTKLTEEEKVEKQLKENIEREEGNMLSHLQRLREKFYSNNPTLFYEVGELVEFGNWHSTEIIEILDNGNIYKIKTNNEKSYKLLDYSFVHWTDINKIRKSYPEPFKEKDEFYINYMQQDINSLLNKYYSFGVNENPIYQRGLVWKESDKENLIDSIFKNVDIGKILFKHNGYGLGKEMYEIVDGKQRARTIIDFTQNKFKYKEYIFDELSPVDRNHILNYKLSIAEIRNVSDEDTMKIFLKVNTTGKVIDPSHLKDVEKMLKDKIDSK